MCISHPRPQIPATACLNSPASAMPRRSMRRWNAQDLQAHNDFRSQALREPEMRRAAKGDDNRHELVEAMKRIGARVYPIGKPLDYLVTFRKRTLLIEIKNPDGRNRLTKEQEDFIAGWDGEIHICRSVEEAVSVVVESAIAFP